MAWWILDGFEATIFESNGEKAKLLQDRHKTFENSADIPAEGSSEAKRESRRTKFPTIGAKQDTKGEIKL